MTEAEWPPIGHNQPDLTATAADVTKELSNWMAETPVVQSEEQAREAKVLIDRASLCIKDLEDERMKYVRPLNERVKDLNEYYRGPRNSLSFVLDELQFRMGKYLNAEEQKRRDAAEAARKLADEAEQRAREAERLEHDALRSADAGELGIKVAEVTENADQAFSEFKKASRFAALAEKESKVRIGGGFRKALSLKTRYHIVVDDPIAAMKCIGLDNEYINSCIARAAKHYRHTYGKWPDGVRTEEERKV